MVNDFFIVKAQEDKLASKEIAILWLPDIDCK